MKTINIIINFVNYCGQQLVTWFIDDNVDLIIHVPEFVNNQPDLNNTHQINLGNPEVLLDWFPYSSNLQLLYDYIDELFLNNNNAIFNITKNKFF